MSLSSFQLVRQLSQALPIALMVSYSSEGGLIVHPPSSC